MLGLKSCASCGAGVRKGSGGPKGSGEWCPACGAALSADSGAWELGTALSRPGCRLPGSPALFPEPERGHAGRPVVLHVARRGSGRRLRWLPWWVVAAVLVVFALGAAGYVSVRVATPDRATGFADDMATSTSVDQWQSSPDGHVSGNGPVAGDDLAAADDPVRLPAYDATADRFGYIDKSGAAVIPTRYDLAQSFSEGLAAVYTSKGWSYIDTSGQEVIPLPVDMKIPAYFDQATPFSEGLAAVAVDGEWRYIDKYGSTVIAGPFRDAQPFSEGLAAVALRAVEGVLYGYIDKTGALVTPARFVEAAPFSEGRAHVRVRDDAGEIYHSLIDRTGDFVGDRRFDYALDFSEGLAAVRSRIKSSSLWGYIDMNGEMVIPLRYPVATSFSEGLAAVRYVAAEGDFRWAYIDPTGALAVVPEEPCNEVGPFSLGLAPVSVGGHWGYIDRTGTLVIPPLFARAGPFQPCGLAEVYFDDPRKAYGYIDTNANIVWQSKPGIEW